MVTIFQAHIKDGVVVPDAPLELPDGTAVDVRIMDRAPRETNARIDSDESGASMLDLLETMAPPGVFKSSRDVGEYLRKERDMWDN